MAPSTTLGRLKRPSSFVTLTTRHNCGTTNTETPPSCQVTFGLSKSKSEEYNISWKITCRAKSYSPTAKRCDLCLAEKFEIITDDKTTLLNTRCDLVAKCRHSTEYQLSKCAGVT
eukprot:scpid108185/ scgid6791/ 